MNIIVIDDDPVFNKLIHDFLTRAKCKVVTTIDPKKGLELVNNENPDVVIVDYKLPGTDGLELLKYIKKEHPQLPVILSTHYTDIRVAVQSIKLGAFDFINKPIIPDELLNVVKMAVSGKQQSGDSPVGKSKTSYKPIVIGNTKKMVQLWDYVHKIAPTKLNVLVIGESGTGKEHIAKAIHQFSNRKDKPFIALDCGALSSELAGSELFGHVKGAFTGALFSKKGLFEEANGGTLFLDEIGNLPYDIQTSLLRALQENCIKRVGDTKEITVDVRIIAATNNDLSQQSQEQLFRFDLYQRLNEFELTIPPLRERTDDLEEYASFFIKMACTEFGKDRRQLSAAVLDVFKQYSWPGNLREMNNMIRRLVLLSESLIISTELLPAGFLSTVDTALETNRSNTSAFDVKGKNQQQEKELIIKALHEFKFNKSKAAEQLGIDRTTLYKKLKLYEIEM